MRGVPRPVGEDETVSAALLTEIGSWRRRGVAAAALRWPRCGGVGLASFLLPRGVSGTCAQAGQTVRRAIVGGVEETGEARGGDGLPDGFWRRRWGRQEVHVPLFIGEGAQNGRSGGRLHRGAQRHARVRVRYSRGVVAAGPDAGCTTLCPHTVVWATWLPVTEAARGRG
jgi:hypothetical protein